MKEEIVTAMQFVNITNVSDPLIIVRDKIDIAIICFYISAIPPGLIPTEFP